MDPLLAYGVVGDTLKVSDFHQPVARQGYEPQDAVAVGRPNIGDLGHAIACEVGSPQRHQPAEAASDEGCGREELHDRGVVLSCSSFPHGQTSALLGIAFHRHDLRPVISSDVPQAGSDILEDAPLGQVDAELTHAVVAGTAKLQIDH